MCVKYRYLYIIVRQKKITVYSRLLILCDNMMICEINDTQSYLCFMTFGLVGLN